MNDLLSDEFLLFSSCLDSNARRLRVGMPIAIWNGDELTFGRIGRLPLSTDSTSAEKATSREDLLPLIHRAILQDEGSLAKLYDAASPLVYGLSLRILGSTSAAEDTVVEVFSGIFAGRFRFDSSKGSALLWITAITRTRALERLRSAGNVIPITAALEVAETDSLRRSHDEPWLSEESSRAREALQALAPDVRKALDLAYFEGLTAEEIAARLLITAETVRTRIRLGMGQLREGLGSSLRTRSQSGRE